MVASNSSANSRSSPDEFFPSFRGESQGNRLDLNKKLQQRIQFTKERLSTQPCCRQWRRSRSGKWIENPFGMRCELLQDLLDKPRRITFKVRIPTMQRLGLSAAEGCLDGINERLGRGTCLTKQFALRFGMWLGLCIAQAAQAIRVEWQILALGRFGE